MDTLGLKYTRNDETIGKDLRENLWYWSLQNRIPIHGGFELTERCNFKCLHCFLEGKHEKELLTTEEIYNYIDQICEAGTLWLTLTGGEPLIRKDFNSIYSYAYQKGLLLLVFSNGYFINEKHIQLFKEKLPVTIEISVYGMTDKTYRIVTGSNNAWEKIKSNVMKIVSEKLPVFLKYIVLKENYHEIPSFKNWVSELGTEFDISAPIHPGVFGDKKSIEHRVPPNKFVEIEMGNPESKNKWGEIMHNQKFEAANSFGNALFRCNAGKNIFLISSDALVHPCVLYRQDTLSLKKKPFRDIWREIDNIHKQVRTKSIKCDGCRYQLGCSICPAWALLEHEDPESQLDYLCETSEQIEEYFRREVSSYDENEEVKTQNKSHGNKTDGGRWRQFSKTIAKSRGKLLQEIPTLRLYQRSEKNKRLIKDSAKLKLNSFTYRQLGSFNLIISRNNSNNSVISLNDDGLKILKALSTPTPFYELYHSLCSKDYTIGKKKLKSFVSGLIEIGIINCE